MKNVPDEEALLAVLNSTPVVDGTVRDEFADTARTRAWLACAGGSGTEDELDALLRTRSTLQAVVCGEKPPHALAPLLAEVKRVPTITEDGIRWTLHVPPGRDMAVRVVLAWAALAEQRPGALRPCANTECNLFLIDRSRAGTARWCSMKTCGNRMKARRHHQRERSAT